MQWKTTVTLNVKALQGASIVVYLEWKLHSHREMMMRGEVVKTETEGERELERRRPGKSSSCL